MAPLHTLPSKIKEPRMSYLPLESGISKGKWLLERQIEISYSFCPRVPGKTRSSASALSDQNSISVFFQKAIWYKVSMGRRLLGEFCVCLPLKTWDKLSKPEVWAVKTFDGRENVVEVAEGIALGPADQDQTPGSALISCSPRESHRIFLRLELVSGDNHT